MLRHALRRVLWSVPTLLATSLVLFFVTTLAPGPLDPLPRFLNLDPLDVRALAKRALSHVAAADESQEVGKRELRRLGGAALPYVLPQLEALAPDARRRVALALSPLAERMQLSVGVDLTRPEAAVLFWTRFWDDRALDFSTVAVNRAVTRLVEHGTDLRESDLVVLDTLALPVVIRAMANTTDPLTLARLTQIASHASERGAPLGTEASAEEVRRAVGDWREWWFVNSTDFMSLDGASRAIAVITDTRYGRWLKRIASGQLGVSAIDGEPIIEKLRARAPITLLLCAMAMLVSFALAVPIGVAGAWWRGRAFDVVSSALMFILYATPTFAIAEVLRRLSTIGPFGEARIALAVSSLAAGSLAMLSRWQRIAMLDTARQEFVRTARAKGMPNWRVLVVHALRNALMPMVTVAGLHLPALLGGAIVVEEVFGLHGAGFETMRAIESHDGAWLTAVLVAAAIAVTLGLVASDVACSALDPRVREVLGTRHGRAAR
jgi:peptide/nickel transport system permease protein